MPEELKPEEQLGTQPQFIMVAGIECSGKTTHIERNLISQGYRIISIDEFFLRLKENPEEVAEVIIKGLRENGIDSLPSGNPSEWSRDFIEVTDEILQVESLMRALGETISLIRKGEKVVFDGVNANREVRQWTTQTLRRYGVQGIECHWMDTPIEVCLERFRKRGMHQRMQGTRSLSEGMILRHSTVFEPPVTTEGFNRVVRIQVERKAGS